MLFYDDFVEFSRFEQFRTMCDTLETNPDLTTTNRVQMAKDFLEFQQFKRFQQMKRTLEDKPEVDNPEMVAKGAASNPIVVPPSPKVMICWS